VFLLSDQEQKLEENTATNLVLRLLTSIGTVLVLLFVISHLTKVLSPTSVLVTILVPKEQIISIGTVLVFPLAFTLLFQRQHTASLSVFSLVNQTNISTGTELVSQNVLRLLFKESKVE